MRILFLFLLIFLIIAITAMDSFNFLHSDNDNKERVVTTMKSNNTIGPLPTIVKREGNTISEILREKILPNSSETHSDLDFSNWNSEEIDHEIAEIDEFVEQTNLIQKANLTIITQSEREDLSKILNKRNLLFQEKITRAIQ